MAKPKKGGKVRNRRKTARLKAKRKSKLRRAHGKALTPKQRKRLKKVLSVGRGRVRLKNRGKNRSTRKGASMGAKAQPKKRTR